MRGAVQMQITTIGLDIAKNVFQVHGIDAKEKVVAWKQLRRSQVITFFKALPPCLIGMEACATAHYWARELTKLGHRVRLMPAKDVKAYVKRNKNDAADAEAICAAPDDAFRAGQIGRAAGAVDAAPYARSADASAHPVDQRVARASGRTRHCGCAGRQRGQGIALDRGGRKGCALADRCTSERLETIPGIGVIGASAIAATVADPTVFRSGRNFAAWIGLVPRQDSTGGKQKLGPISKQGDRYLRRILVVGAHSVLRRAKQNPEKYLWLTQLLARRPFKVVAVALANKMARMAWALLAHGGTYRAPVLAAAA